MKGDLSDKWATAPMPSNNGAYPGTSLAGGASLVINRNSKHKTAVWNFIEFLSKREIQLEFYSLVNDLPSVKSSWEDTLLTSDKYMQAFFEQFHNVTATPKINEWEQIAFSKVQQYAEMAVRSQISIDKVLLALDNDVNKILEKRRWLLEKNNE
jgi:multiple sugar transport system substrate-binding protein